MGYWRWLRNGIKEFIKFFYHEFGFIFCGLFLIIILALFQLLIMDVDNNPERGWLVLWFIPAMVFVVTYHIYREDSKKPCKER